MREEMKESMMSGADAPIVLAEGNRAIVQLDPDHPGFRDGEYVERRNRIAQIAVDYVPGAPIPDAPYAEEEQAVWRRIWEDLDPAHRKYACAEYLHYADKLALSRERIPQLAEVSDNVNELSGFRLEPVGGLVNSRAFLSALSEGVFLATQYIRHHSTPLYTPEPDVCHELAGHAAALASPTIAELNRQVGHAAKRTKTVEGLKRLSTVYWFTIEFGAVHEDGMLKAYGAGLLSSFGELARMVDATVLPMDFARMEQQEYDVTMYQPILYAAPSFDAMVSSLTGYLQQFEG